MKTLIVANWKMNPQSLTEAKNLFNSIKRGIKNTKKVKVVICAPSVFLLEISKKRLSGISLGAQDCFWENKGPFTGEISPKMLKNIGCEHVIIGHSERREHLKETDEMINRKVKAALKNGLKPILCIEKVSQIKKNLKGVLKRDQKKVTLAYEPVWAIGTGKACSIPYARKVNDSIKRVLGKKTSVLYGGSVSSKNAKDFIKGANFQGLLIGGASVRAKEFVQIIHNVSRG
jgi:triosephosphate isomerase